MNWSTLKCVSRTRARNRSFWRVRRKRTMGKLLIIDLLCELAQHKLSRLNGLFKHSIFKSQGDKTGFKLRWRQIYTTCQHLPEIAGEQSGIRTSGTGIIGDGIL